MSSNAFRILGIESREDSASNLLAYLINQSPAFAQGFVEAIREDPTLNYGAIRAYTRLAIPDMGVPDIVLKAARRDGCSLYILENKLKASEGRDQTVRYSQQKTVESLKRRLESLDPTGFPFLPGDEHFVFLTLFEDLKPESDQFKACLYDRLLPILKESSLFGDERLHILCEDFAEIIEGFYNSVSRDERRPAIELLFQGTELDANFQNFRVLMRGVGAGSGIRIDHSRRASWRGRKSFYSVLRRDEWVFRSPLSGEQREIHLEPTLDCLSGERCLTVRLHQELSPYKSRREITDPVLVEKLKRENRDFADFLRTNGIPALDIRVGWNGIGAIKVPFSSDTAFGELKADILRVFSMMSPLIDAYCAKLAGLVDNAELGVAGEIDANPQRRSAE